MASMRIALLPSVFLAMASGEACLAEGGCSEEPSLLQVDSTGEGAFCPKFFKGNDAKLAGKGVQQARSIFIKYCVKKGYLIQSCNMEAGDLFDGDDVRSNNLDVSVVAKGCDGKKICQCQISSHRASRGFEFYVQCL